MRNGEKSIALLAILWLAGFVGTPVMAADIDVLKNTGALDRLFTQAGVYNVSKTGKIPDFVCDPSWPQPLPHSWLVGQIGGLSVDWHNHIWVYNRPRTLTDEEAGLEKVVPGATDTPLLRNYFKECADPQAEEMRVINKIPLRRLATA